MKDARDLEPSLAVTLYDCPECSSSQAWTGPCEACGTMLAKGAVKERLGVPPPKPANPWRPPRSPVRTEPEVTWGGPPPSGEGIIASRGTSRRMNDDDDPAFHRYTGSSAHESTVGNSRQHQSPSAYAVASLILALTTWVMWLVSGPYPIVWALAAVVCGHVALHYRPSDRMALWGLRLAYGWAAIVLVIFVAMVVGVTFFGEEIRHAFGASVNSLAGDK
jgi:hypothetical protein